MDNKFVLFPIKYSEIWDFYKTAESLFWTAEEIDLQQDVTDWKKLNDNERYFISHVLAFFAGSDGIVAENLAMRFYNDVDFQEAKFFYSFQMMIENIHSEVYSLLIDTYISNQDEKDKLFNAISTIPIIKEKADWALKWINSSESFAERLIAFSVVEGLFFASSFCSIYWIQQRGLLPGLSFSNSLIARDESMHFEFNCLLYKTLGFNISQEKVHNIIKEAVEIEYRFCCDALPVKLIGMNSELMSQYVKFVADRLCQLLGYDKIYNEKNPFDFMELISLQNKGNFFERKISDYSKSSVNKTAEENSIKFDADF
jgi:ribonucleoside-diphosphate reductase beta chain